jgi:hypothetical protein
MWDGDVLPLVEDGQPLGDVAIDEGEVVVFQQILRGG